MARPEWVIWGSELSPFTLKLQLSLRYFNLPFRLLPAEAGTIENLRYAARKEALVRGLLPLTHPQMTNEDEFPLVPFLFGPNSENLYDSTEIALWLQDKHPERPLIPKDPAAAFLVRLIDDYADEFGLYMAHHNRWVLSAANNNAGARLAKEYRSLLGPASPVLAKWFSARQVRRLPYLFSVAAEGANFSHLPKDRRPPIRESFPETHGILDAAFLRLLSIVEKILSRQPYLLGEQFTLADAAIYGQLAMNLTDPEADNLIQQQAPNLHEWLLQLHKPTFVPNTSYSEELNLDGLKEFIVEIKQTHIPLMQQNEAALEQAKIAGLSQANEAAFNRGDALYSGRLNGKPFRSVAKTFQAKVWRQYCGRWNALTDTTKLRLDELGLEQPSAAPH